MSRKSLSNVTFGSKAAGHELFLAGRVVDENHVHVAVHAVTDGRAGSLATTLTSMPVSFLNFSSTSSSRTTQRSWSTFENLVLGTRHRGNANNITATISPNFLIIPSC